MKVVLQASIFNKTTYVCLFSFDNAYKLPATNSDSSWKNTVTDKNLSTKNATYTTHIEYYSDKLHSNSYPQFFSLFQ